LQNFTTCIINQTAHPMPTVARCRRNFWRLPPKPGLLSRFCPYCTAAAALTMNRYKTPSIDSSITWKTIWRFSRVVIRPDRSLGFAAHSLRAVSPSVMSSTIEAAGKLLESAPIHIHVAEQMREVNDCVEINGARPVAWLYDQCDVTDRWCLIHATHVDPHEQKLLAQSGAIVGLCPTTEANLGDGIFPAAELMANNGFLGVGSDSQVCTSPAEELRLLEYSQRFSLRRRTVLVPDDAGSNGRALTTAATIGGNRARGERLAGLQPGARGDLVEIGSDHVEFAGRSPDQILDTWIFSGPDNPVQNVVAGGRHVVHDGVHPSMESASRAYRDMVNALDLS